MQRVAKRIVVFQWDDAQLPRYWLIRDYLPEVVDLAADRPSLAERAHAIGASMQPVLIPWDCVDGFFHAYWRRPEAYLQERVRRGTSVWTRVGAQAERPAVAALRADLESGAWQARNAELLEFEQADLGARLDPEAGACATGSEYGPSDWRTGWSSGTEPTYGDPIDQRSSGAGAGRNRGTSARV